LSNLAPWFQNPGLPMRRALLTPRPSVTYRADQSLPCFWCFDLYPAALRGPNIVQDSTVQVPLQVTVVVRR